MAEFCNPFVPAAGGSPQHLHGIFCMALDAVVAKRLARLSCGMPPASQAQSSAVPVFDGGLQSVLKGGGRESNQFTPTLRHKHDMLEAVFSLNVSALAEDE